MITILAISITAFTFSEILISSGNIFAGYLESLKSTLQFDPTDDTKLTRYKQKLISILGGCAKCMAGQIAFWYFLFHLHSFSGIFELIAKTCAAIFCTYTLQKLDQYVTKEIL